MFKLVIEDDEGTRTMVPLTRDHYVVGRKEGSTIRLTERNISREHVRVFRENGARARYAIEDLTSYNGVYVNGLRVASTQELVHGDLVQLGDYRILFQDESIRSDLPPGDTDEEIDLKKTMPRAYRGADLTERPDRLVVLVGPTPGAEFQLDRDRMTIGRAEEADISVNHNSVSRIHCEVCAIGDGRFEIVDQGSSNGVVVNGSELRRGIIEPGDTIELGDVRFRFVAAGQVFVPNPAEGSQLTAIGDRDQSASVSRRSTGILMPALAGIVLGVVALVVVGLYMRKAPNGHSMATAGTADVDYEREEKLLGEAVRSCTKESCEESHVRVTTGIRPNSRLRESQDFKFIETQWAEGLLERANDTTDPAQRRDLYRRVAETTTVELSVRQTAEQKLALLVDVATPTASDSATTRVVVPVPPETAEPVNVAPPTPAPVPGPVPGPVPPATHQTGTPRPRSSTPTPSTAPPRPTSTPTAAPVATVKPSEPAAVPVSNLAASTKANLLPKARNGTISPSDANALYFACKELKDQECKALAAKYK